MKALIVEDDEMSSKVLGMLLTRFNCEFDIASTGQKAIELYFANHYNIVFMDVGLPDISGIEVSEKIRQSNACEHKVPIVAITAHVESQYKEAAINAGIDDFLIKPVVRDQIFNIINKLC